MNFKENGYLVIKNFLNQDFVEFIQEYFFIRIQSGTVEYGSNQAPKSYEFYSDALADTILNSSCSSLSEITGYNLLPTYSFTRLYQAGDELEIHIDRPSCEISATLSLGIPEGEEINPIYFSKYDDGRDAAEIKLEPGDLCLYRGCDLWHWRPPFTQKWYLQSFLHYVDADGPYKNYKYDERKHLNMPPVQPYK